MGTKRLWVVIAVLFVTPLSGLTVAQTSWSPQGLVPPRFVRALQVHSGETAWLTTAGGASMVFATTDGGAIWQRTDTAEFADWSAHDLAATETGVLLSASVNDTAAAILRSSDGGITWTEVHLINQPGSFINGVRMTSATEGVAIADPIGGSWVVLLTSDGGMTWHNAPTAPVQAMGSLRPEVGWEHSMAALPGGYIWFGTDNSRVYRSTDGGASWSYGTTPPFDVYGVAFSDPFNGVAACGSGLAHTTDGGATWTHIPAGYCNDVVGINGMFWVVQGRDILESTDIGATWDTAYTGAADFNRIHATIDGGSIMGWAGGTDGQLVKFIAPITGAASWLEIPRVVRLQQNYPNPFNPSTTIRYELPERSNVTVVVFNTVGQQVAMLVEGEMEAGSHEAKFDASRLPSGVYLYKLQAGNHIEVRKALLMK